jgi:hypothetical protein
MKDSSRERLRCGAAFECIGTEETIRLFVYSPIVDLSPASVLSMWAGGIAAGSALVARWGIVGRGFTWLAGGVILLFGAPAAALSGSPVAWVACACAVVFTFSSARRSTGIATGVAAALAFLWVTDGNPAAVVSGAVFLGGVTVEMMLGHWYLVDPQLPRWALRRLAIIGGFGVVLDVIVLAALGVFPWPTADLAVGLGFVVLAVTSGVLMLGVFVALGEDGYAGVMSATGLSYLALLTAIGAVVIGRLLVEGPVL